MSDASSTEIERSSIVNAALYNGTLGYYCDIEAHHPGAILHAPAIMVPAALKLCRSVLMTSGQNPAAAAGSAIVKSKLPAP